MGGVFYEYGFFVLKDAGGEMRWERVDDGKGRGIGVMHFHYSPKGRKIFESNVIVLFNIFPVLFAE